MIVSLSTFFAPYNEDSRQSRVCFHEESLAIACIVISGNGMRCPVTILAKAYGGEVGYVGDTYLPERFAQYTFRIWVILLIGLLLLAL
jgi:hypothetical protein